MKDLGAFSGSSLSSSRTVHPTAVTSSHQGNQISNYSTTFTPGSAPSTVEKSPRFPFGKSISPIVNYDFNGPHNSNSTIHAVSIPDLSSLASPISPVTTGLVPSKSFLNSNRRPSETSSSSNYSNNSPISRSSGIASPDGRLPRVQPNHRDSFSQRKYRIPSLTPSFVQSYFAANFDLISSRPGSVVIEELPEDVNQRINSIGDDSMKKGNNEDYIRDSLTDNALSSSARTESGLKSPAMIVVNNRLDSSTLNLSDFNTSVRDSGFNETAIFKSNIQESQEDNQVVCQPHHKLTDEKPVSLWNCEKPRLHHLNPIFPNNLVNNHRISIGKISPINFTSDLSPVSLLMLIQKHHLICFPLLLQRLNVSLAPLLC